MTAHLSLTIQKLLTWMEEHLKASREFQVADIAQFFADHFVIKTNSRVIQATPETYLGYLYQLKSRLKGVKYEREEMIEAQGVVVAPFIIELEFMDQPKQRLQAISIFKMNDHGRITEWKEVFANTDEKALSYD